ncbi:MAG TPA: hypothetical protein ENH05_09125 [Rhizobiales bacterium]|nr:hypothetical protein [Hyphomicrobiales bacterium]
MRTTSAATLALTLGMLTATGVASAAPIVGSWSGRGTVRLTSGQVEPVSCRVRYEKGDSAGKTFTLDAKCATTAGTFLLYGRVSRRSASSYRGSLYGEQSTVSGKITISVRGDSQTVRVSNSRGSGSLNLRKR